MRKHADFHIVHVDKDKNKVFIIDLDLGNISVTNDAEHVFNLLQANYPDHRVVYRDSTGHWDEIIQNKYGMCGFREYKEMLPWQ